MDSTSGDNNNQQKCCDPPLSTGCVVPSNALPPANGNLGTCIPGSKMGKQYEVISVNAGVVAINSNSPMSNVKVGERMTFASVDQGSPCPALGEVFVTVLDSATSFTVEKRGDGNNVPNDKLENKDDNGDAIKNTASPNEALTESAVDDTEHNDTIRLLNVYKTDMDTHVAKNLYYKYSINKSELKQNDCAL